MVVTIGRQAPSPTVSAWFGGKPTNIDRERGDVVLVEVFQINCLGCFLYGIPQAIRIHRKYGSKGVKVIGLATAFEDYDKNPIDNLKLLLNKQEVIGDTCKVLEESSQLLDGKRLPYGIPFPVAADSLSKDTTRTIRSKTISLINSSTPSFSSFDEKYKLKLVEQMQRYFDSRQYYPETFEEYGRWGTPSTILIDKQVLLRQVTSAQYRSHESMVEHLLIEKEGVNEEGKEQEEGQ